MVNMKCFVGGIWKQIARRSCPSYGFPFLFEARAYLPALYSITHGSSGGSLEAENTSPNYVLFQLEGKPFAIFAPIKSQISTGQDFDYIIKGYCLKGRFGD